MPRDAYSYRMILEFLETNPGIHTTKEIEQATQLSYGAVARAMSKLAREKRVKRRPGPGHSYRYEFLSWETKKEKELALLGYNPNALSNNPPVGPIKSSDLREVLIQWSKNGWSPRSIGSAQTLLTVMSQLHQFYWLSLNRGLEVDQSDLDHCKAKLKDARDAAFNFAEFFDSLLNTRQIWDAGNSAAFVLEGLDDESLPVYLEQAKSVGSALR